MNKRKHSEVVEELGLGYEFVKSNDKSEKNEVAVAVVDDTGNKSVDNIMRDVDVFIQNLHNLVKLPRVVHWICATEVSSGNTLSAFRFNNVETVGEAMKKAGFRSSKYTTLLRQLSTYGFHGFGNVKVKGLHATNRSSVFLHPYAFNRMGDTDYKAKRKDNAVPRSTRHAKRSKNEYVFTKCLKSSTQVSPTDNLCDPAAAAAAISNNIIKFTFVKEVPKIEDPPVSPPRPPAAQAQDQIYYKNNKSSNSDLETQAFNYQIDSIISSTSFLGGFDSNFCAEGGDEEVDNDNTIGDGGSFDEITEEEISCPIALRDSSSDLLSDYEDTEAVWFDYFIEQWS